MGKLTIGNMTRVDFTHTTDTVTLTTGVSVGTSVYIEEL
jgi:hypothetical protein